MSSHRGQPPGPNGAAAGQDSEVSRFVRQVLHRNGISLNGLGNAGNLVKPLRLQPRNQDHPGSEEGGGATAAAAASVSRPRPRTASDMASLSHMTMRRVDPGAELGLFNSHGMREQRGQWAQPSAEPLSATAAAAASRQPEADPRIRHQQPLRGQQHQAQHQQQHLALEEAEEEEEEEEEEMEAPLATDHVPGMVVIHVKDAQNKTKKNFSCERNMLAEEMKYFAEYLSDASSAEDIDISVHCDVKIFTWLINYVKLKHNVPATGDAGPPTLSTKNVVSILISSDFLKMDHLVELCIKFCHDHLNVILKGPTNMACITNKLLTRLTEKFSHSELAHIKDKKDKLLSKLYWKKIEQFFEIDGAASLLWSCSECKKLLLLDNHEHVMCTPGRIVVDYQGQVLFNHLPDPNWDVNHFLSELRLAGMTPKDIYWRIWGLTKLFTCTACGHMFSAAEFNHCQYHPGEAEFKTGGDGPEIPVGIYKCCGQATLRFDPTNQLNGCSVREHTPAATDGDVPLAIEEIREHLGAVTTSFQPPAHGGAVTTNVFALETQAASRPQGEALAEQTQKASEGKPRAARKKSLAVHKENADGSESESDDPPPEPVAPRVVVKKSRAVKKRSSFIIKPAQIRAENKESMFRGGIGVADTLPTSARIGSWQSGRSQRKNIDMQRMDETVRMAEMVRGLVSKRTLRQGETKEAPHLEDAFARIENRYAALQHAARLRAQREKAAEERQRRSVRGKPFF